MMLGRFQGKMLEETMVCLTTDFSQEYLVVNPEKSAIFTKNPSNELIRGEIYRNPMNIGWV